MIYPITKRAAYDCNVQVGTEQMTAHYLVISDDYGDGIAYEVDVYKLVNADGLDVWEWIDEKRQTAIQMDCQYDYMERLQEQADEAQFRAEHAVERPWGL